MKDGRWAGKRRRGEAGGEGGKEAGFSVGGVVVRARALGKVDDCQ